MLRQPALPLPLNGPRIAGTSAAIALHAIVLMLLFTPTTWAPAKIDPAPEFPIVPPVDIHIPQPIPITDKPKPVIHSDKPTIHAPVTPPVAAQVAPTESDTGPLVATTDIEPTDTGDTDVSNAVAELRADVAPTPTYPPLALRAGTTGLVVLRIEVDTTGHPIAGSIEKSSGSRLLDQAALKFVLARWHFNPARRAGSAVSAVALVPISFTLD